MATAQYDSADPPRLRDDAGAAGGRIADAVAVLRPFARLAAVALLDAVALIAALEIAAAQTGGRLAAILAHSGTFATLMTTIPVALFVTIGLTRRSWRFISYGDALFLAGTVALGLLAAWGAALIALPALRHEGLELLPFAIVHGALAVVLLAGMRVLRRAARSHPLLRRRAAAGRPARIRRALLLGDPDWARTMIELIRSDEAATIEIVGVLTPDGRERRLLVGGVPVLGSPDALPTIVDMLDRHGRRPTCILLRDDGSTMKRSDFLRLVALADRHQLVIARTGKPTGPVERGQPRFSLEYLPLADLLGRPEITLARDAVTRVIAGRRVLVTGAGGTIGSELVRQLAAFGPAEITLLDHGEFNLYAIDMEMRERFDAITFHAALCSVRQRDAVFEVFDRYRPDIVFHAAALKHVPLVENNPCAGAHTNVIGTRNVADAVCEFGVRAMVQVSTDKAVNPVGMMGVTKRLGELYCQSLDLIGAGDPDSPRFMTVRFGNVLGSSGSLVPLFQRQLAAGKPLTVTHPDIERFFMTVEEAVQLILSSSAHALEAEIDRGTIYVLDMGEPIKIVDIARRMIRLAGLEPEIDVPIRFVGLRPGEKLYEELFDASEERFDSTIPGIFEARPCPVPLPEMARGINELERLVHLGDADGLRHCARALLEASSRSPWSAMFRAMIDGGPDREAPTDEPHVTPPSAPATVTLQ